jgi:hypothetical protein
VIDADGLRQSTINKTPTQVNRRDILRYGVSLATVAVLDGTGISALAHVEDRLMRATQTGKLNIVFILMDNLGYGEVGCYGGGELRGAPTLRIDKLASEGTRLTNYNVEAQCSPSRSALMMGRFAIRSGTHSVPKEEYPGTLTPNAWVGGPMLKIVSEFEASLKKFPPITPGTLDPYTPPSNGTN